MTLHTCSHARTHTFFSAAFSRSCGLLIQKGQATAKMDSHTTSAHLVILVVVYNHWTGLVDWTSGLDYWTQVFRLFLSSY